MITHLRGDATRPILQPGKNVILHCVNNIGKWGRGFVVALGRRYPAARREYLSLTQKHPHAELLGWIQLVPVGGPRHELYVCNLFGQDGIASRSNTEPIHYEALAEGLGLLQRRMMELGGTWTIHMPRMGTGLAGGRWDLIEALITEQIAVPVYVYTLEPALATS